MGGPKHQSQWEGFSGADLILGITPRPTGRTVGGCPQSGRAAFFGTEMMEPTKWSDCIWN